MYVKQIQMGVLCQSWGPPTHSVILIPGDCGHIIAFVFQFTKGQAMCLGLPEKEVAEMNPEPRYPTPSCTEMLSAL